MKKAILVLSAAVLAHATVACASTLIGDDVITEHAAFARGLNKSDFTISNSRAEGDSKVRMKTGQQFNCSVGVTVSVLGHQEMGALCARKGEPVRTTLRCAEVL